MTIVFTSQNIPISLPESLAKKARTQSQITTIAQPIFHREIETSLPRRELRPIENPYKRAALEIGTPQIDLEGKIYKKITINEKMHIVEGDSIGSGDSFRCFQSSEDSFVIKVFIAFQDSTKAPRKIKFSETDLISRFDLRMDFLRANYEAAQNLKVPSAKILNIDSLKKDGCIIQEAVRTIGTTVPWDSALVLTESEKKILESFCDILLIALINPTHHWDLMPKNFGVTSQNELVLFDFSDRALDDQQFCFEQSITKWVGNNPEAKELIFNRLMSRP